MIQESMITKESIISSLEEQIDDLIRTYENQMNELKNENANLKNELNRLKCEIEQLTELNNQLQHSNDKNSVSDLKDLKALTEEEKKDLINEELKQLHEITKHSSYENSSKHLLNLTSMEYSLFSNDNLKQLTAFLEKMFHDKGNDLTEMDDNYKSAIWLINQFIDKDEMLTFLRNNSSQLIEKVIDSNEPNLITELASSYFISNSHKIFMKYLNLILDQWDFIDANIEKPDFVRLLWMCFFISLDNKLVEKSAVAGAFLKDVNPDIALYKTYYDIVNKIINFEKGEIKVSEYKNQMIYLKEKEKEKVFKSLDKRLKKQEKKATVTKLPKASKGKDEQTPRKILFTTKLPNNIPILPGSGKPLREEWVYLAIYRDLFFEKETGYVLVKGLSDNRTGKVYVTQSHIKEIRLKAGNGKVNIKEYSREGQAQEILPKSIDTWPSTELSNKPSEEKDEKSQFNETSELRRLGYQITGLTRAKRWNILEVAVKQLGLKKVVYTIAQNVKLRKGQKNGETKFSYAIAEWEHDLAKLKQLYYRNNFGWPSTRKQNE